MSHKHYISSTSFFRSCFLNLFSYSEDSPWKDGLYVALNPADRPFRVQGHAFLGLNLYQRHNAMICLHSLSSPPWKDHNSHHITQTGFSGRFGPWFGGGPKRLQVCTRDGGTGDHAGLHQSRMPVRVQAEACTREMWMHSVGLSPCQW